MKRNILIMSLILAAGIGLAADHQNPRVIKNIREKRTHPVSPRKSK